MNRLETELIVHTHPLLIPQQDLILILDELHGPGRRLVQMLVDLLGDGGFLIEANVAGG